MKSFKWNWMNENEETKKEFKEMLLYVCCVCVCIEKKFVIFSWIPFFYIPEICQDVIYRMDHRNDSTWSNINIILSLSFRLFSTAFSISLAFASRAEQFRESETRLDQPGKCMLCLCVIVIVPLLQRSPFGKTIHWWFGLVEIYLYFKGIVSSYCWLVSSLRHPSGSCFRRFECYICVALKCHTAQDTTAWVLRVSSRLLTHSKIPSLPMWLSILK